VTQKVREVKQEEGEGDLEGVFMTASDFVFGSEEDNGEEVGWVVSIFTSSAPCPSL